MKIKKKNILIAEKYIKLEFIFQMVKETKNIFEEIILSKNKFYSILSIKYNFRKKFN